MKTAQGFKQGVLEKYQARLTARKKVRRWAAGLICVFLLPAVITCGYLALTSSQGTGQALSGKGVIPRSLQVAKPQAPKDLSSMSLFVNEEAYSEGEWEVRRKAREANFLEAEFPQAVNAMARDCTSLLLDDFQENACFSPLSLYYALALTGTGASGETRQEFLDALHAPDLDWVSDQCGKFYRLHYRDNEISRLLLANSLWLDGRCEFQEDFLAGAEEDFYSSLFQADFTDPALNGDITDWISENTGGLLSPQFEFTGEERLAIINTLYLYAQWTDEFLEENTSQDTFTRADGTEVTADFMHKTEQCGSVLRGENFTRASLGLRDVGEMIFILPDEGTSPADLLSDPSAFAEMFFPAGWEKFYQPKIEWSLPKFSIDAEYDLTRVLAGLGLETAFDPERADFSAMASDPLFLSCARQGTHIGIDENGVEAAAYTTILMTGEGAPPDEIVQMDLNRPFLFAILSSDTLQTEKEDEYASSGTLLFVGVCGDPTA